MKDLGLSMYPLFQMILLLSERNCEESTNLVIDWISFFGADFQRINGEDLVSNGLVVNISGNGKAIFGTSNESGFKTSNIKSVWFRRWRIPPMLRHAVLLNSIEYDAYRYLVSEFNALSASFFAGISKRNWLNKPSDLTHNKIFVLTQASLVGLKIPETLICQTKVELRAFHRKHSGIISKSIGDTTFFRSENRTFSNYTVEITDKDIDSLEEHFYPSLFQSKIDKQYELRIFYLDGDFHAMAIFSQGDRQTEIDFRQYNTRRPNRCVPYNLPAQIKNLLTALMKRLDMNCGSIDLVRDKKGNYNFLEVNPVGQFSMVSYPCNYHLERKVAQYLIKQAHERK
ncbi:grasp-with-spasm system ATP-grasp peptide maturase [Dyadobacter endophyticus]|uniref:grasp-with-spasm system ATP-grasp peptide maturase n=1 Tax=Dyadobacter endophyticus TaxID=1749036 RepID=UPI001665C06C|nr:grasp-with-spasm system ATP-grasp peptide maturase [Dyadobacter endophyticus]